MNGPAGIPSASGLRLTRALPIAFPIATDALVACGGSIGVGVGGGRGTGVSERAIADELHRLVIAE